MSLSISILNRPTARDNTTAPLARLTSQVVLTLTNMQRRRARRHMTWAVVELGHPEVTADLQRAMRN